MAIKEEIRIQVENQIKVMSAFLNGERIEYRGKGDKWSELVGTISWDFTNWEYRIKQVPQEFWVVCWQNSSTIWSFPTKVEAIASITMFTGATQVIKVREVLDTEEEE